MSYTERKVWVINKQCLETLRESSPFQPNFHKRKAGNKGERKGVTRRCFEKTGHSERKGDSQSSVREDGPMGSSGNEATEVNIPLEIPQGRWKPVLYRVHRWSRTWASAETSERWKAQVQELRGSSTFLMLHKQPDVSFHSHCVSHHTTGTLTKWLPPTACNKELVQWLQKTRGIS